MKKIILLPLLFTLSACNGDWKPYKEIGGFLAEPAGNFESDNSVKVENLCSDPNAKVTAFDEQLKPEQKFVRTRFIESGNRNIFMKLTSEIKDVSTQKLSAATQISDVMGFDIGDAQIEDNCEIKDVHTCAQSGDVDAPKPHFEFEDCYVNDDDDKTSEIWRGTYTFKSGQSVKAVREKSTVKGSIFCRVDGEVKSIGTGAILTERLSSPEIIAFPLIPSTCGAATIFLSKTAVLLESSKKLEYVRQETTEVPLRTTEKK